MGEAKRKRKEENNRANYAAQLDAIIKMDDNKAYAKLSNELLKTMKSDAWDAVLTTWQPIFNHHALKCLVEAFGILGALDQPLKAGRINKYGNLVSCFFGSLITTCNSLGDPNPDAFYFYLKEVFADCVDKWFSNMKLESARQYAERLQITSMDKEFKKAMTAWIAKNEATEIGAAIPAAGAAPKNMLPRL